MPKVPRQPSNSLGLYGEVEDSTLQLPPGGAVRRRPVELAEGRSLLARHMMDRGRMESDRPPRTSPHPAATTNMNIGNIANIANIGKIANTANIGNFGNIANVANFRNARNIGTSRTSGTFGTSGIFTNV
jgi:hypothetical protein